jgi:hypothetical protein
MPDTVILGVPNAALAMASADQTSIIGNGTREDPLRTGEGNSTFLAEWQHPSRITPPVLGAPVAVIAGTPAFDVAISIVSPGNAGDSVVGTRDLIVGFVASILTDPGFSVGLVVVQTSGTLTLTNEQWSAVTSPGLDPGQVYYLQDQFDNFGLMSTSKPTIEGHFVVPIGIALSESTLLLAVPSFPIEVTGT